MLSLRKENQIFKNLPDTPSMDIDWESDRCHTLLNPRFSNEDVLQFSAIASHHSSLKGHVWLASSGTSGFIKLIALSKKAILVSAAAVNDLFNITSKDVWVNPLPLFHIGGLAILARSYLSKSKVVNTSCAKWSPIPFYESMKQHRCTITSLVPAQLYDLIHLNILAPPSLRCVIVGGGCLSSSLFQKALSLQWPICPSYGMTECSSQVATALPGHIHLKPLSHVSINTDQEGFIHIKSYSLLTCYAFKKDNEILVVDPKVNGWLKTEDKGDLVDGALKVLGRSTDFIKIGGESVDLNRLESLLQNLKQDYSISCDMALFAHNDDRLGHVIHLASSHKTQGEQILKTFNTKVLPFEAIRKLHVVAQIPRSPLKKLLKQELVNLLNTPLSQ